MNTFVSFIKNLLSISDEGYIGLSQFTNNAEKEIAEPKTRRKKDSELTLSELLRKN